MKVAKAPTVDKKPSADTANIISSVISVDPTFTRVLKSINGGKYSLDMICDNEIAWKRGYRIANKYVLIRNNIKYTLYSFGEGDGDVGYENHVRTVHHFIRTTKRNVSCQIIAVSRPAGGDSINITYDHLGDIKGISICPNTVAKLKKISTQYDELAPPLPIPALSSLDAPAYDDTGTDGNNNVHNDKDEESSENDDGNDYRNDNGNEDEDNDEDDDCSDE